MVLISAYQSLHYNSDNFKLIFKSVFELSTILFILLNETNNFTETGGPKDALVKLKSKRKNGLNFMVKGVIKVIQVINFSSKQF